MIKKIGLLGASVLVSLIFLELGARVLIENPFEHEELDHMLRIQRPHANSDLRIGRETLESQRSEVRFRTDERGYIVPSRRFDSPDATIAFVGGSTTECSAVGENARFHARVSTDLERLGFRVNSLNAGRSGNTAHDSLNVLLNHVLADQPDFVVMMHATNDIGVLARMGSYSGRMGSVARYSWVLKWIAQSASTRSTLVAMIRRAAAVKGGALIPSGERVDRQEDIDGHRRAFESRLVTFVAMVRAFGSEPVLMTQPLSPAGFNGMTPTWVSVEMQAVFNRAIRELAEREAVTLVDLAAWVPEHSPDWDRPMNLFYDGMHVTDRGAAVYAELIRKTLLPRLQARAEYDPPAAADLSL